MNAKGAFQMKYNGQELTPITTPQIFDPPKEMFVWDNCFGKPIIKPVYAITRREQYPVISNDSHFEYCAEIPEEQKPKRATNLQLMKWLSRGYGIWKKKKESYTFPNTPILEDKLEEEVEGDILIQPFGTTEWVEPTLKNMGMEDK